MECNAYNFNCRLSNIGGNTCNFINAKILEANKEKIEEDGELQILYSEMIELENEWRKIKSEYVEKWRKIKSEYVEKGRQLYKKIKNRINEIV